MASNTAPGLLQAPGLAHAPTAAAQAGAQAAEPRIPLGDSLRIIGTGQSGMTADQYAMMRERVLAFLTTDEDALRGSLWAYTSSELAALRAKRSELERYQEALAAE